MFEILVTVKGMYQQKIDVFYSGKVDFTSKKCEKNTHIKITYFSVKFKDVRLYLLEG